MANRLPTRAAAVEGPAPMASAAMMPVGKARARATVVAAEAVVTAGAAATAGAAVTVTGVETVMGAATAMAAATGEISSPCF